MTTAFQKQYTAEVLQQFRDMRRIQFLMLIRKLEYELYIGIYGEEPDG